MKRSIRSGNFRSKFFIAMMASAETWSMSTCSRLRV